jgi:hypothetical protein
VLRPGGRIARLDTAGICAVELAPIIVIMEFLLSFETLSNLCNIQEEHHDSLGIAQYPETLTIFNPERFCALSKGVDARNEPMCNVAVLGGNHT